MVGVSFSACLFSSDVEDALFLRNESGVSLTECFIMASFAFLCPVGEMSTEVQVADCVATASS